jgi:hypothetical protein
MFKRSQGTRRQERPTGETRVKVREAPRRTSLFPENSGGSFLAVVPKIALVVELELVLVLVRVHWRLISRETRTGQGSRSRKRDD